MPGLSGLENKLPVFTTPQQQITFYADDPSTYKQILTIYNPYDFLVKFKISSTDCSKYTVSVPQGAIKSNHAVDIILQHKAVTSSNIGISDTVRIQLHGTAQVRAGGRKDITITLLATAPQERALGHAAETERFQQLEADAAALGNLRQHPFIRERNTNGLIIYSIALMLGGIVLLMPNEGDESEYYPKAIPRPSYEHKLVVAFLLGVFLVLLCRT